MTKNPLYFDDLLNVRQSPAIWTAQPSTEGWIVISPMSEEIGSIYDDGNAYFVTSERLGIRMVQRKTVKDCMYVIALALYEQQQLQERQKY